MLTAAEFSVLEWLVSSGLDATGSRETCIGLDGSYSINAWSALNRPAKDSIRFLLIYRAGVSMR